MKPCETTPHPDALRQNCVRGIGHEGFPLTPALSPKERENRRPSAGEAGVVGISKERALLFPLHEPWSAAILAAAAWNAAMRFVAGCSFCVEPAAARMAALRFMGAWRDIKPGNSLPEGEEYCAFSRSLRYCRRLVVRPLMLSLALTGNLLLGAADLAPSASPSSQTSVSQECVSAPELDRAIKEVISQRKYAWRMPREKIVEDDAGKGPVARFFASLGKTLREWARAVSNWINELIEKLLKRSRTGSGADRFGLGWIASVRGLIFLLTALVVCALAILLYRVWRNRQRKTTVAVAAAITPTPDITDETVDANQLPEDGWIQLGRELIGRGELRLAIRAFYLASLSHLAARNLIAIARFKSNCDYERELRRRGHALPDLLPVFGENVLVFDRIWYGLHEVNDRIVDQFAANVEKIKAV